MAREVFTNYWEDIYGNVRKQHGSYASEEEAKQGIEAWWELHGESYPDSEFERTNTGALEIEYGDGRYHYRVEKRTIDGELPKTSYKLKSSGEVDAIRKKYDLDKETYIFDELSEPYRDRIIQAMADIQVARDYTFTDSGEPISRISER